MPGIMTPEYQADEPWVLKPFVVSLWRKILRRPGRDIAKLEAYLKKPHGEFHTCKYCEDK